MQAHWEGYLNALGKNPIPATSTPALYQTSSSETGVAGFLDLSPKSPEIQAKYDAMSGSWAGVDASNKAISKGVFSTDAMPIQQIHPYMNNNVGGNRQSNANAPKSS
jgi:hypothetical protein